jgi:hypothetical protein
MMLVVKIVVSVIIVSQIVVPLLMLGLFYACS